MRLFSALSLAALLLMIAVSVGARAPTTQTDTGTDTPQVEFKDFDAGNFDHPTTIDNPWMPMNPGRQSIYEGDSEEDGEKVPHRIEFTVTDLTKEVDGVQTVVAWIEDYIDNELVEKELAFYAQDNDGNVWYFGEHPEEYENGEFVEAPTWIAGLEEAKPGVKMVAEPQLGTPDYYQGWGPAVEWSDYSHIDQVGQETCVPVDCYQDVLVIAESSLAEENAFQLKYYAHDVGQVRVGWRGEDATQEELQLVKWVQLDAEALAKVQTDALTLEKHAYEISPDVYGLTAPAQPIDAMS